MELGQGAARREELTALKQALVTFDMASKLQVSFDMAWHLRPGLAPLIWLGTFDMAWHLRHGFEATGTLLWSPSTWPPSSR